MTDRSGIEASVREAVLRSGALRVGDRLLVAVSGGPDSTALALVLGELRETLGLFLVLGHVNHGLRGGESDADEQFVRDLAERLDLPLDVARLDLAGREGCGEEAARHERFRALRTMAQARELDRIALGHTATDRAETVLMNVLRGTGLDGLAAMTAVSGDLIRPLLRLSRAETAVYCKAKGVVPRYDGSNDDPSILRNRVRLSLMPLLEREYQPGIERSLVRLGEIAEAEVEWTGPVVEQYYRECAERREQRVVLDLARLREMPAGLRWRVLRLAAAGVRGDRRNLTLDHLRSLDRLVTTGQTGQRAEAPGLVAERRADSVLLRPAGAEKPRPFSVTLAVPGCVAVEPAGLEFSARLRPAAEFAPESCGPYRVQLDAALAGPELVIRAWQPGDRLVPLGMSGTKKLQDLLVDKKIPRADREGIPIVATTRGEILWVVGHCMAETAKVTPTTEALAELEARPLAR